MLKGNKNTVAVLALMVLAAPVLAAGLKRESLGGVKLFEAAARVVKIYGAPKAKVKGELEAATGCLLWTYQYPKQGLEFEICAGEDTKEETVSRVRAFGNSPARTGKGIGLGSSSKAVRKAYGRAQAREGVLVVEDEACWCGLYFTMRDGKVSEIWFAPMAE